MRSTGVTLINGPMVAPTEDELVVTVQGVVELCGRGSFKLVKIASNSMKVLKAVPEELRGKGFKDPEVEHNELKVLGLARLHHTGKNIHLSDQRKRPYGVVILCLRVTQYYLANYF